MNNAILAFLVDALKAVFASNLLTQYKTYLAAAGLFGLALYQFSQGQVETALSSILAGVAAIGLRHETAPVQPNA